MQLKVTILGVEQDVVVICGNCIYIDQSVRTYETTTNIGPMKLLGTYQCSLSFGFTLIVFSPLPAKLSIPDGGTLPPSPLIIRR